MKFDSEKFAARGGFLCGDDDFEMIKCKNCGFLYLHNEEISQVYFDPNDLELNFLLTAGYCPPCKNCTVEDWDFETVDLDSQEVLNSSWAVFIKN